MASSAPTNEGRITATDAVLVTGHPRAIADRLLLELAVRHGGDVTVSDEGAIVYTFDRFMTSTGWDLDETTEWLTESDGRITVAMVAERWGLGAADALGRLSALQAAVGGTIEHRGETALVVATDELVDLQRRQEAHAELRDFRFIWERLELSPAIIRVPDGKRGWIIGFNTTNIIVSTFLMLYYGAGGVLLDMDGKMVWLGWLPFGFSWSVFVIPFVRNLVAMFGDRGRRRRNAHRVALPSLAHRLQQTSAVTTAQILEDLSLSKDHHDAVAVHLKRFATELEGDLDPENTDPTAPIVWRFETAHWELLAVEHARDELDPRAFHLDTIVSDTATPMP